VEKVKFNSCEDKTIRFGETPYFTNAAGEVQRQIDGIPIKYPKGLKEMVLDNFDQNCDKYLTTSLVTKYLEAELKSCQSRRMYGMYLSLKAR
jgi:hypothetical protein